jgi:hypothetical protein
VGGSPSDERNFFVFCHATLDLEFFCEESVGFEIRRGLEEKVVEVE